MDIKQVKHLIRLMIENDLTELDVASGEEKVHLKRGGEGVQTVPAAVPQPGQPAPAQAAVPAEQKPSEPVNLIDIKSPMVGTFYAAATPESDPFVDAGDAVDEDTVICVVEAMKVMNEIKAECAGTIAEICVKNAQSVEYGQVLFRVMPASEQ